MKRFYRISAGIVAVILAIFIGANVYLQSAAQPESGRPWQVEVSRLALAMEQGQTPDLSACQYVTDIVFYGDDPEDFYQTDRECVIRQVNGGLYRFDYVQTASRDDDLLLTVNVCLGIMAAVVMGVLLYIRQKILRPFEVLTEVPYELSRGNLTAPIKENPGRLFGRFVWGVDLLRENMEQQKARELELQKEKKTLLLSLSHDIKTPLSAIKLYAKALSKGLYADTDRQREIAESINAKADEIEGYVSQIVRASNEDFLSLEVNMGEFYLSELVGTIDAYYREKLGLIRTDFSVGSYVNCLLKGDLDRSVEVLQNIIENAIKYGDGREISLRFGDEDGCILISVGNTGCDLPDTELPHIFDSFWRGSNAENHKGSGLGLYICRQLMHKMGGETFAAIQNKAMTVTAVWQKA